MVSTLHSFCSSASFILSARFAASTTLDVDDVDAADADADALALSGIAHPLRILQHWIVVEKKEGHRRITTETPHHRTAIIPSHYPGTVKKVGERTRPRLFTKKKKREIRDSGFSKREVFWAPDFSDCLMRTTRTQIPSIPSQTAREGKNSAQLAPDLPLILR